MASGHYHKLLLHPPNTEDDMVFNPGTGRALVMAKEPGRVWIDRERGLYRIHDDDRYWMSTGSFLKGYVEDSSTYSERRGYEHTDLGYGHIEVRNDRLWKIETVTLKSNVEEVLV